MKKIKLLFSVAIFACMSVVGYTAYDNMGMSDVEKLMLANVEALTGDEDVQMLVGRGRTVGCGGHSFAHFKTYCCPNTMYYTCHEGFIWTCTKPFSQIYHCNS